MAIDFQRQTVTFPPVTGRVQSTDVTFVFGKRVLKAETAINGYKARFNNFDKPLGELQVDTTVVAVSLNTVQVRVSLGLRDSSGFFDDAYGGSVEVMLIADLAA